MKRVLIIGSGPAGISASLYLARADIDVTVISAGESALEKAGKIENYFGFSEAVSGKELIENGKSGAKRLGVKFREGEIVDLNIDANNKIEAYTSSNKEEFDCVLLATGSKRKKPDIKGLKELEGKGVSYCAVCDAFFHNGKPVAVIGSGSYAMHEAVYLAQTSPKVTILTNHENTELSACDNIDICDKKIAELTNVGNLRHVIFDDGSHIEVSGIFVAAGIAGSTDLANKLGAFIEGNTVKTDKNMFTGIPGLYAAGDCTGGLLQVSKAVYEGAAAAMEIIKYLRKN